MAHFFVVLHKILLNVPMYTSSYFAWTPRIALICVRPTIVALPGYFYSFTFQPKSGINRHFIT